MMMTMPNGGRPLLGYDAYPGKKLIAEFEKTPLLFGQNHGEKLVALYSDMVDTYNREVAARLNTLQARINAFAAGSTWPRRWM